MTASPPAAARATSILTNPAPDITFRGVDYRLAEPGREQGASVRYTDFDRRCRACPKDLPAAGKSVRLADRVTWLHIGCAIRSGDLVPAESVAQARRASV